MSWKKKYKKDWQSWRRYSVGKWEMMKIGDVFDSIKNGASIKQGDGERTGYPITRIETISDGVINRERMGYAGITEILPYTDNILESGDILMSHINSVKHLGKTAIYEKRNDEIIIHGMNLLRLKPNKEILNSKYAKHYFDSYNFKKQIPRITKNSVNQSSFNVSALQRLDIPLPPLEIQKKIADILDISSAVLEKRRAQIDKLDLLVKSQFIEMFGDPVTNPKGWDYELLEKLGELNRGVSKHRPRNDPKLLGGDYPLIQTGDVANAGLYITDYRSTYTELGLKQSKLWPAKTLCITIAANIAKTSILKFDACFPDSIVGFISNSKTNNIFINYWFNFFQKILEKQAPESAQKNINLKILRELLVINPPIDLQNEFAIFVNKVEAQKVLLQESLVKLDFNHKSLVQKCFRGEIA